MMDKVSYALGIGIGHQLANMGGSELNIDDFAQAVKDVLSGNELKVKSSDAQRIVQEFFAAQEEKINKQRAEQGKAHKEAGEHYLAENAKKDGVVTLVKCHYEGFLIDGTVFDSSVQRGEPAVFGLQQVIAGWTEGLQLMQEGAKYRFFIPYRLAYGEGGAGASIPPYAALIFDVELIQVM